MKLWIVSFPFCFSYFSKFPSTETLKYLSSLSSTLNVICHKLWLKTIMFSLLILLIKPYFLIYYPTITTKGGGDNINMKLSLNTALTNYYKNNSNTNIRRVWIFLNGRDSSLICLTCLRTVQRNLWTFGKPTPFIIFQAWSTYYIIF